MIKGKKEGWKFEEELVIKECVALGTTVHVHDVCFYVLYTVVYSTFTVCSSLYEKALVDLTGNV